MRIHVKYIMNKKIKSCIKIYDILVLFIFKYTTSGGGKIFDQYHFN